MFNYEFTKTVTISERVAFVRLTAELPRGMRAQLKFCCDFLWIMFAWHAALNQCVHTLRSAHISRVNKPRAGWTRADSAQLNSAQPATARRQSKIYRTLCADIFINLAFAKMAQTTTQRNNWNRNWKTAAGEARLSVCGYVCLSIRTLVPLSVCLFLCLYVCLSVPLFLCLRVCLSLSLRMSLCLSVPLSLYLSVCLCLSFPSSTTLSVPLSVSPSFCSTNRNASSSRRQVAIETRQRAATNALNCASLQREYRVPSIEYLHNASLSLSLSAAPRVADAVHVCACV